MMNKNDFKSAMNEIKCDEDFKRQIIKMMSFKNKAAGSKFHWGWKHTLSACVALFVILTLSVLAFNKNFNFMCAKTDAAICMLETDGKLYFKNDVGNNGGSLCAYDRAAGKIKNLHTPCVVSMTQYNKTIYFGTSDCKIYALDTKTYSIKKIATSTDDGVSDPIVFFADSNYLYYFQNEKSGVKIYKFSLKSKTLSVLYQNKGGYFNDAILFNNLIYFSFTGLSGKSTDSGVFKMDTSGNNVSQIGSFESASQLSNYKNSIIFSAIRQGANGTLYKFDENSKKPYLISALSANSNFSVYENTGYCYGNSADQDNFYAVNLDTGKLTQMNNFKCTYVYAVKDGVYCYYPGYLWFYNCTTNSVQDIINNHEKIPQ